MGSFDNLLPKNPLVILDQQIDMRPPLSLVLAKVGEDSLPAWLRKPLTYWQGPKANITQPCEGHFATLIIPPKFTKSLLAIAKQHEVTLNGLLSTIFIDAEVLLVKEIEQKKEEESISIRYLFPIGHGIRTLSKISSDQVGNFIAASEHITTVNTSTFSDPAFFWTFAKQITLSARVGVRETLDFIGLLGFLPRNSITPWLIQDGKRYNHGRRSSLEISNLGRLSEIEKLKQNRREVAQLFDDSNEDAALPEVYLINGRNYRGSVFNVGVSTVENQMCVALQCQLGHCGCERPFSHGSFAEVVKGNAVAKEKDNGSEMHAICACPKHGMLQQYCTLIQRKIKALVSTYTK